MTSSESGPRIAVAVTAVVGLLAVALGATAFGVALVLLGVVGAVATAVGPVLVRGGERPGDIVVPRWVGPDARALATDQRRLAAQLADPEQVDASVRPRLAALVAGRLARRGVDPGSAEATVLLGEPLAAFLAGRGRRTFSPAAFGALLDRVEAL